MYGAFALLVLVGTYLMFQGPDSITGSGEDTTQQDEAGEAALALFGGGAGGSGADQGDSSDYSLFENNDLMDAGVGEAPIAASQEKRELSETGILDPVSEGNPINPQTGQPYPDSAMKQFEKLAKKFPDNSIIPRRMTPELKAQKEAEESRMREIRSRMSSRNASAEEIGLYYENQKKSVTDRLQLVDYVLENQGDRMAPDIKKQFEKVKELNLNQIESYEKQKQAALERMSK